MAPSPLVRIGLALALGGLVACLAPPSGALAATHQEKTSQDRKMVLLVYGESRVLPAAVRIDAAIRSNLEASGAPVEFFTEHLDLSWTLSPRYEKQLAASLREKYAGRRLDLVVPVAANALRFVLEHRAELFPGIPIVFSALDPAGAAGLALGPDVTGVWMIMEAAATMDIALRLQPDTQRVVVIGGASPLDRGLLEDVRRDLARRAWPAEISYLAGLSLDETKKQVAGLGSGAIILVVSMLRDGAGNSFVPKNASARLAKDAAVPIYGLHETVVGSGAVGGRVVSFEAQGARAAELVARVLAGEPAGSIPQVDRGGNVDMFDWRALRRWGLDENRLPPGSIVVNRERSTWELYRWYIVSGISLVGAQTVLVAALLLQRARRRRAERSLAERLKFEMLVSELSAGFLDLPAAKMAHGIESAMERIAKRLGLDRSLLVEFSSDGSRANVVCSWSAGGVPPVPAGAHSSQFPWATRTVRSGEVVRVSRLEDLPEEAAADRQSFGQMGARSIVIVPLVEGQTVIGAVSFTTVNAQRDWPDQLVQRFRLVADIFSNALIRMRGELEAQKLRRDLGHVGRVATVGELTASMAHELNQPLAAILSNAQAAQRLLSSGQADDVELKEILSDIVEDDKRAGAIIQRLRTLLKKGEIERAPLDVNEVIREVARLVQSDALIRNVPVATELAEGLPPVAADRVQLQQVILNLMMNGLEATSGSSAGNGGLLITSRQGEDGTVQVSVRDHGQGVPRDALSHVFDPFYTTKSSGLGMGLSIARSIIEAHGGRLWGENDPGGGAIFSFTLPVDGAR